MPSFQSPGAPTSFISQLTFPSIVNYGLWRLQGMRSDAQITLNNGQKIILRSNANHTNDYGVAYEVFVSRLYDLPQELEGIDIRKVVDIGANSGYTVLNWLDNFPGCEVIAIEAHPRNVAAIRRNLALNNLEDRVEVITGAAGNEDGHVMLTDAGSGASHMGLARDCPEIEVEMFDVFERLKGQKIDLLKIDIEGAEFPLLADPRFHEWKPKAVILEWHLLDELPDAKELATSVFTERGYRIKELFDEGECGMFWAIKPTG